MGGDRRARARVSIGAAAPVPAPPASGLLTWWQPLRRGSSVACRPFATRPQALLATMPFPCELNIANALTRARQRLRESSSRQRRRPGPAQTQPARARERLGSLSPSELCVTYRQLSRECCTVTRQSLRVYTVTLIDILSCTRYTVSPHAHHASTCLPRTSNAHAPRPTRTSYTHTSHACAATPYFPWLCTCGELTGNTRGGWAVGYDKRAVQARAGHLERVVGARYTDNTRARDRATRHRRRSPFVSGISFRDIEMQVLATGRVCMRYEMKSVPFCSTKSR
jgi:hypothetical protein